ncbi:NADPH:quinone reductase-like Zn-dependent oxidoreductase [Breoghania corrubedonensis]|uniref:NADPH:quinone reductase-like Zn-dependent oxidoreductase n=1 Tax=Breoghania corrubedonensis TaxID=665038 RepID=A0A2T5US86_9HYPH|nr:NADPH:quinone reductase [Breoghania corrubedonensis]PTW54363.1 NADPH:quinone reductase-like Zn-dependent oxidoreductase [Breoghania corrubedonensis]
MKAVWFETFGKAGDVLRYGEREKPEPAAGEVLVRLRTSAPNPSDVKKRMASFPNLLDEGFVIPHSDGAGVIEAVGEGVSPNRTGERVWVFNAQYGRRFGTAAEYVSLPSAHAPRLPDQTSFEAGACLGIPAMTAHRCVFADGSVAGRTILITGGAGRVGFYAIQWASQAGARIIATASNGEDEAACREAGAALVVNHRQQDWPQTLLAATGGGKVDRVIDVEFGANLEKVLEVVRTGGVIATYSSTQVPTPTLPFFRMMYLDLTIRMVIMYAMPEEARELAIADIEAALVSGRLTHRVARTLLLDECAEAHRLIEEGKVRGSVVLTV